ncbi:DUF397 domain-containing protein [Streptomyces chryseus]|uniref:DUF397 domain-containing protein n=1 Tax=Streptomyces chryseus TaxID=68186 RepID=A0ABQ3EA50_9ACTN|nr:DUF397 domain-containing protein [Streptomyces chryseus]GHB31236.1 hypothetical protein GCM10010346_63310 [Streptomyces chryseus]
MTTLNPAARAALPWRKSSFSGANESQCVEVAPLAAVGHEGIAVRDSKRPDGPIVQIGLGAFAAFVSYTRRQTV